jgi:hypothetical protein
MYASEASVLYTFAENPARPVERMLTTQDPFTVVHGLEYWEENEASRTKPLMLASTYGLELALILKSQCPSIFTTRSHYMGDF